MRNFLISFLLATLIMIPTEFYAEETIPHSFSAGDTISADMLNEIMEKINNVTSGFSSETEILGTWSCSIQTTRTSCPSTYVSHSSGLYKTLNQTLTFSDDGDGTYSYSTSISSIGDCGGSADNPISNESFAILNGNIVYCVKINPLIKISPTKFVWDAHGGTPKQFSITCSKENLPPTIPATLTVSASGKTVSIAWTDSSTDETGFKVLRKDSLTGSYSTITTTSADATSYSDTVTTAGSYWYRVSATNSNGDSVASKMVKVDVE